MQCSASLSINKQHSQSDIIHSSKACTHFCEAISTSMNHQIIQRSVFVLSLCVTFLLHVTVSTNSTCPTVDSKSLPRLCPFRSVCRGKQCAERRSVSGDGQHLEYRCDCDSLCDLYGDCCDEAERCPIRLPSDLKVRMCA